MEFGVPRRRESGSSNEKFENVAVLTASEFKGKGTGRTLSLNKKAIEGLGIDFEAKDGALISFSFNKIEGTVSIANTTGLEGMSGVRLAKTSKSVSDKAYFEAIKANFGIKVEDSAEFLLTKTENEFNGNPVFTLSAITAVDVLSETVNEAVAEIEVTPTPAIEAPQAEAEAVEIIEDVEEAPIEYIAEQIQEQEQSLVSKEADAVTAEEDFFAGFNN